jgi:hypothetical protein
VARIRTIKPSFWKHEELSALPEATHMLAAALLNYADDYGYFNANPKLIAAECCPLREPSVPIPESLRSLSGIGWLQLGAGSDGKRYGRILKFDEHQKVSHPAEPKISKITITWDTSGNTQENSGAAPERLRPEGNKEEEGNKEGNGSASTRENVSRATPDMAAEFDAWYAEYPLRRDRGHAWSAYRKARKKTDAETLLAGAKRYASDPARKPDFTAHPATWLNGERWLDAAAAAKPRPEKPKGPVVGSPEWHEEQRRLGLAPSTQGAAA